MKGYSSSDFTFEPSSSQATESKLWPSEYLTPSQWMIHKGLHAMTFFKIIDKIKLELFRKARREILD